MRVTKLRQCIEILEEAQGALTVQDLAAELDVTPERAEGLVDFWIRKGRIVIISDQNKCGSCGIRGECPLLTTLPVKYELADVDRVGSVVV